MRSSLIRAATFLGGDGASRAIAFISVLVAARILGSDGFGAFSFVYAAVAIGLLVCDLGLTPFLLRQFSKDGYDEATFWTASIFNVALGLAAYGVLALSMSLAAPAKLTLALTYGLVLPLQGLGSSVDALLLASNRSPVVGVIRLVGNSALAISVAVGIAAGLSPARLGAAFLAGNVTKVAGGLIVARRSLSRPVFTPRALSPMLRRSIVFSAAALASFLYFRLDILLVGALRGDASVGQYAAAYRFIDALILVPGAVAYAFFPGWAKSRGGSAGNAVALLGFLGGVGVVAALALIGGAQDIVRTLLGSHYAGAGHALAILAFGVPFLYVDVIAVWIAYSRNREASVVWVGLVALAVNVALNLILIPRFDFRGAAVATVVSEIVNFLGYCALFRTSLRAHWYSISRALSVVAVAGAAGGLSLGMMRLLHASSIAATFLSCSIAVVIAWRGGLFRVLQRPPRGLVATATVPGA
jgi:O-antigen/teichoic acid export membrane protein